MQMLSLVVVLATCQLAIGLDCPVGLNSFSASSNSEYHQCNDRRVAILTRCPNYETYVPRLERCVERDEKTNDRQFSTNPRSLITYLSDVPVLGRPVLLGDLYDTRKDQILTGESFWSRSTVETEKQRTVRNGLQVNIYSGRTSIERMQNIGLSRSLSMSYLGGLMNIDGSARYLKEKNPMGNEQRLTYEYKASTHFETIKSNVRFDNGRYCDETMATHVVSTITYGSNSRLSFSKTVEMDESRADVGDELYKFVKKIPAYKVQGSAPVKIEQDDKEFTDQINVDFHGGYMPEKNPTTYEESIKVYNKLQGFLGKWPTYDRATAVKMELTPLSRYCSSFEGVFIEIGQSVFSSISNILEDFEKFDAKSATLLQTKASKKYSEVRSPIAWFRRSLHGRKAELLSQLRQLLPEVRSGKKSEADLIRLVQPAQLLPFTLEKSMEFLSNRESEIKIIDATLEAFDEQSALKVTTKSYREANNIQSYLKYSKLVILDINILQDTSIIESFVLGNKTTDAEFWYNNMMKVMALGQQMKQFKDFVLANKEYQLSGYLVRLSKYQDKAFKTVTVTKRGGQLRERDFFFPTAPQIITQSAVSVDSVTFNISAPSSSLQSGTLVIAYFIHYWKESEGRSNAIPQGPYLFGSKYTTIEFLAPLTSYRFQLVYATGYGQSPASEESSSITTKATSPPINARETGKTSSEISVSWSAPVKNEQRMAVSHYTASAFRNGEWVYQISVNGLQATFAKLEGQTEYQFTVVAVVRQRQKEYKSHPAHLKVITCPDAPSDLQVNSIGYTTADLSWSAPRFFKESSRKQYSVEYFEVDPNGTKIDGTGTRRISRNETNYELTNLVEGRRYSARVQVRIAGCVSGLSVNVTIQTNTNTTAAMEENNEIKNEIKNLQNKFENASYEFSNALQMLNNTIASFVMRDVSNDTSTDYELRDLMINQTTRMIEQQRVDISNEIDDVTQRATGCKWEKGDGRGTVELLLTGKFETKWDCYRGCVRKRNNGFAAINGATYRGGEVKRCWCERNMLSVDSQDHAYITCRFAPVLRKQRNGPLKSNNSQ